MAMIIPFAKTVHKSWSPSEQSEFARAVHALRSTGLPVVTESGLSDEGDPWTVFLREDTGDVVVHISRIDGRVIAASAASPEIVSGPNFRTVVDRILKSQPLVLPAAESSGTLFLHPSAAIVAFIATALSWSYSEEAGLNQYVWRVDEDGRIEPVPQPMRPGAPKSVLADTISSKAETAAAVDNGNALSGRLAIAASIAAVALAADLVTKGALNVSWHDLTDQSAELSESSSSPKRMDYAATSGGPLFPAEDHAPEHASGGESSRSTVDVAGTSEFSLPSSEQARDHVPASRGAWEQFFGQEAADTAESLSSRAIDYSKLAFPTESPAFVAPYGEMPALENHARASSGDAARPNPLATSQHTDFVTGDASEFLSILFSQKIGVTYAGLQDLSVAVSALSADHLKRDGDSGFAGSTGTPTPVQSDGGFKLVEDILNFAFDRSHELSTSMSDWTTFSEGLKSNAFLPEATRVLIIDIPDLRADAFKFADGLLMVSQEFAAQHLPGTSLVAQTVLDVSDGVVLKLIGVIDLSPPFHA